MGDNALYQIPFIVLQRLDVGWNLVLLLARYAALIITLPGIGSGMTGLTIRYPMVICLALVSLNLQHLAPIPADIAILAGQLMSEVLLGAAVGMVPLLIVAGASTAGQIASGTIGLNGAQLFDPTTSSSVPDLSRIYSDLCVLLFLFLGGHHVAIAQLSGLESVISPGTFVMSGEGIETLVTQSGRLFQIGCMIAAPVIVALLLTNFVMAMVSRAVPTVNIFIVSSPLMIGIGLVLSMIALPEVLLYLQREIFRLEPLTRAIVQ